MGPCSSKSSQPKTEIDQAHPDVNTEDIETQQQTFQKLVTSLLVQGFQKKYQFKEYLCPSKSIFSAIHHSLKTLVAVKVLTPGDAGPQRLEQILHLHKLVHPNVVQVFEIYKDQSDFYITHQYAKGGNMDFQLKKQPILSEQRVSQIMVQIISGLNFLHGQQIGHRFLTSKSILFTQDNIYSNIVITHLTREKILSPRHSGAPCYYTHFCSPETIRGKPVDKNNMFKSDIWACGVMLYLMLSSSLPFEAATESSLQKEIERGVPQFRNNEWSSVSNEAIDLIQLMLTFDEKKRPTAYDLLSHKWFKRHCGKKQVDTVAFKQLTRFNTQLTLQTIFLHYMTFHLITQEETTKLMKTFESLDVNHDQRLTKEEILNGLQKKFGDEKKAKEFVDEIFAKLDEDGNGDIDYREFILACSNKKKLLSDQNLVKAFRAMDTDSNGYINQQEIGDILKELHMTNFEASDLLIQADKNQDGKISLSEFKRMMKSIIV